ncbi:cytochrome c oxidase assembly factor Coa1 family protein [Flavobacterium sp. DG1-102-2]|uniref:cytochrome c oxidase assembly factor Coa1 family protein n=1 Tax=Flavobacterium sp. DG1-102-2 TaxID=3081663 RepID=UPI0029493F3D|nr:cytochrome c oxidase assembly factor Coa1 family protein [Flavobacterium sp. DG1-102-2]MDV6167938.1 cytochrome c oxidase assembly factor Coa1 family protein [Flavobacterium sp. DG1-102-2]
MENHYQSNNPQAEFERLRQEQKRKNRKKIIIILCCVIVFFTGIAALVFSVMKNSDAYTAAEYYIMHDPQINKETGGIKELGAFPSGNINTVNGHGKALLTIDVKGIKKDVKLTMYLEKHSGGEWKVLEVSEE